MAQKAIEASEFLEKKKNIKAGVVHFGTIKPLDHNALNKWIPKLEKIITVEENNLAGGFGSSILEYVSDKFPQYLKKIVRIGLTDKFVDKYGTQDELLSYSNLTVDHLVNKAIY